MQYKLHSKQQGTCEKKKENRKNIVVVVHFIECWYAMVPMGLYRETHDELLRWDMNAMP